MISWSPVGEAASYQLFIAPANAPGSPVLNISGLTSTSFQLTDPLPNWKLCRVGQIDVND